MNFSSFTQEGIDTYLLILLVLLPVVAHMNMKHTVHFNPSTTARIFAYPARGTDALSKGAAARLTDGPHGSTRPQYR